MQLADTNVISELMRQRPHPALLAWRDMANAAYGRLTISAVTVDEIACGLARRPHGAMLAWFDLFLERNQVLAISAPIARRAGEMRAQLAARGHVRTQADMLIAATAQVHALTLVTRNVRDFDGCGIAVLDPFVS